jgi:hypothetical protein
MNHVGLVKKVVLAYVGLCRVVLGGVSNPTYHFLTYFYIIYYNY